MPDRSQNLHLHNITTQYLLFTITLHNDKYLHLYRKEPTSCSEKKMHTSNLHNILNKWSLVRKYLTVENFTLCSSIKQHWSLGQRWANHSRNRPRRLRSSPRACPPPAWRRRRPSGSWGSPSRGHWSRSRRPPPGRKVLIKLCETLVRSGQALSLSSQKLLWNFAGNLPCGSSASVSTASGRTLAGSPGQHRHCDCAVAPVIFKILWREVKIEWMY